MVAFSLKTIAETEAPVEDRIKAMDLLAKEATILGRRLRDEQRVADASDTAAKRIKPGEDGYMVHLRHCYPKGGIDGDPDDVGYCKYGEDDICPAALFDDPWKEYCRIEDEEAAAKAG